MARLTIRPRPEYRDRVRDDMLLPHAYEVLLDDRPIRGLKGVEVHLVADDLPRAVLSLYVDELDVDVNVLTELTALVNRYKKKEEEPARRTRADRQVVGLGLLILALAALAFIGSRLIG